MEQPLQTNAEDLFDEREFVVGHSTGQKRSITTYAMEWNQMGRNGRKLRLAQREFLLFLSTLFANDHVTRIRSVDWPRRQRIIP